MLSPVGSIFFMMDFDNIASSFATAIWRRLKQEIIPVSVLSFDSFYFLEHLIFQCLWMLWYHIEDSYMWLRVFTATISRRLNGYTLTLWSNVAFIVRNDLTTVLNYDRRLVANSRQPLPTIQWLFHTPPVFNDWTLLLDSAFFNWKYAP